MCLWLWGSERKLLASMGKGDGRECLLSRQALNRHSLNDKWVNKLIHQMFVNTTLCPALHRPFRCRCWCLGVKLEALDPGRGWEGEGSEVSLLFSLLGRAQTTAIILVMLLSPPLPTWSFCSKYHCVQIIVYKDSKRRQLPQSIIHEEASAQSPWPTPGAECRGAAPRPTSWGRGDAGTQRFSLLSSLL